MPNDDPTRGNVAIRARIPKFASINKRLGKLSKKGIALDDVLRKVADLMEGAIMDNFVKKANAQGTSWPPAKKWYEEVKAAAGRSADNLLVYNGTLKQSLSDGKTSDGQKAAVGTNVPYARIHNFGGTVGAGAYPWFAGKKIPKRQFMYLSASVKEAIRRAFLQFIGDNIKGAI